jgi:hypothetical protein
MTLVTYIMAPESISTAYFINPFHQSCVSICVAPIVARQRLDSKVMTATNTHVTITLLDESFFMQSMSYQRRVCRSVCVTAVLVCLSSKRWSEGSQSRQTVKYGLESRRT